MELNEHTTKAFDADLQKLVQLISEMGGQVEKQFADSIDALVRHDRDRAQLVVAVDARNISKRVATLNGKDMPRKALSGVKHIATLTHSQLHDVLDSFASRDIAMARDVWVRDEEIDAMYTSLFREVLTYMMEDPEMVTFGIHLLFCAKNIERMGDHATNIAEAVCYMVEGHTFSEERPKADMTPGIGELRH
jgi:phosphate transport system protein